MLPVLLESVAAAPTYGPETYYPSFFGFLGVASALIFCNIGAAYGTAKTGIGLSGMGVMAPNQVMKNIIPIIMAGVIGIYGLIVAVILQGKSKCFPKIDLVCSRPDSPEQHPHRRLELLCLQWLQAPRLRPLLRPVFPRRRSGYWRCR